MSYRVYTRIQACVFILVTLAVSACATLTQHLDPPQVSLASVKIKSLGLFEQRFTLQLRIQNPNAVTLPIAGMDYDLFVNEQAFARGVSNQAVDVPAHGEALAEVDVTSDLTSLLNQLKQIGSTGKATLDYRLKGSVSLVSRAVKLPFSYEGKVGFE